MSNIELGKIPPQAIEVEEAVIGALLISENTINTIIDLLSVELFYNEENKQIIKILLEMYDQDKTIDILTVTNEARKKGVLEKCGGAFKITKLTSRINSSANIEVHCRILQEMHIRRKMIEASGIIAKSGYDDKDDVFESLGIAEKTFSEITNITTKKETQNIYQSVKEARNQIIERQAKDGSITGIPSGINSIDKVTSGWQNSDLIILAGRPGMGKTALALTLIKNMSIESNKAVAFFSLEMSNLQLTTRLISMTCELDGEKLKKGTLTETELKQMDSMLTPLIESNIHIDDTAGLSIREFKSKSRLLKRKHDIKLIVVDYLQLMKGDIKQGNRTNEIDQISRELKVIAKELDIPVIALAQLSRDVEKRGGDKRPRLSDLRDSGSIEQDADIVMFLHRPEYYGIREIQDADGVPISSLGVTELNFAKHRNGSLETAYLKFKAKQTSFKDLNNNSEELSPFGKIPSDRIIAEIFEDKQ